MQDIVQYSMSSLVGCMELRRNYKNKIEKDEKLLKSFKTEINPTEEQKVRIRKTGTCRFIYNFYLAHNRTS